MTKALLVLRTFSDILPPSSLIFRLSIYILRCNIFLSPDDFILPTFRYLFKLQNWFWALTLSYSSQVDEKLFLFYISMFCCILQIIKGMIEWSRNDNISFWDLAENVLQLCFLQVICLLVLISWKLYFIKIVFTLLFVLIKLAWGSLWLILNSRSMTPFFYWLGEIDCKKGHKISVRFLTNLCKYIFF